MQPDAAQRCGAPRARRHRATLSGGRAGNECLHVVQRPRKPVHLNPQTLSAEAQARKRLAFIRHGTGMSRPQRLLSTQLDRLSVDRQTDGVQPRQTLSARRALATRSNSNPAPQMASSTTVATALISGVSPEWSRPYTSTGRVGS